jgi:hypothetical protein
MMTSMPRPVPPKILLAAGFVLGAALAACSTLPRPVSGLPDSSAWVSLPLSDWLAEDRAEPEAVALCETCGAGMTIGVVRLVGPAAREAEAELRDPQRLVRILEASRSRAGRAHGTGPPVVVRSSARALRSAGASGFVMTLWREDGAKPAIHGAALGRKGGDGLTVVLVIGTDAEAVEGLAGQVARDHPGS